MNITTQLTQIKQHFIEGLSGISRFWGFPKGMGTIFGVLYLSPSALSLDELVKQTGLTKGAISTEIRSLARMGLVHRSTRLGDRKDYYEAETDFYHTIRSLLKERQNNEFDRSVRSVSETLDQLKKGIPPSKSEEYADWKFALDRIQALQDFFDALDSLTRAITRLESLGYKNIQNILKVLR